MSAWKERCVDDFNRKWAFGPDYQLSLKNNLAHIWGLSSLPFYFFNMSWLRRSASYERLKCLYCLIQPAFIWKSLIITDLGEALTSFFIKYPFFLISIKEIYFVLLYRMCQIRNLLFYRIEGSPYKAAMQVWAANVRRDNCFGGFVAAIDFQIINFTALSVVDV